MERRLAPPRARLVREAPPAEPSRGRARGAVHDVRPPCCSPSTLLSFAFTFLDTLQTSGNYSVRRAPSPGRTLFIAGWGGASPEQLGETGREAGQCRRPGRGREGSSDISILDRGPRQPELLEPM